MIRPKSYCYHAREMIRRNGNIADKLKLNTGGAYENIKKISSFSCYGTGKCC